MYHGTLTDMNSRRDNGQPNSIKFRHKSTLVILTYFSSYIEDCNLEKIKIKIIKKPELKEQ